MKSWGCSRRHWVSFCLQRRHLYCGYQKLLSLLVSIKFFTWFISLLRSKKWLFNGNYTVQYGNVNLLSSHCRCWKLCFNCVFIDYIKLEMRCLSLNTKKIYSICEQSMNFPKWELAFKHRIFCIWWISEIWCISVQ